MTVNITIGRKETSAPMFPCGVAGCRGASCRECLILVKQEHRAEAPIIGTATAQGPKRGGYNFIDGIPGGFYSRWMDETNICARFPWFNIPTNDPLVYSIPDILPGFLHCLAVDIEMGVVKTANPPEDAQFTCWMAWWTGYAIRTYGLKAAILFS